MHLQCGCLAQKAFVKGKSVSSQILHEDHPYFVTAYPIRSSTGIDDKAVVIFRDIAWLMEAVVDGDPIMNMDGFQPENK